MKMDNKVYDILKEIALTWLPAFATAYAVIGKIWGLPFVTLILVARGFKESEAAQVASIIMAGATVLGYVLGEGLVDASNKGDKSDGNV